MGDVKENKDSILQQVKQRYGQISDYQCSVKFPCQGNIECKVTQFIDTTYTVKKPDMIKIVKDIPDEIKYETSHTIIKKGNEEIKVFYNIINSETVNRASKDKYEHEDADVTQFISDNGILELVSSAIDNFENVKDKIDVKLEEWNGQKAIIFYSIEQNQEFLILDEATFVPLKFGELNFEDCQMNTGVPVSEFDIPSDAQFAWFNDYTSTCQTDNDCNDGNSGTTDTCYQNPPNWVGHKYCIFSTQ
jgi:hypothetical protein